MSRIHWEDRAYSSVRRAARGFYSWVIQLGNLAELWEWVSLGVSLGYFFRCATLKFVAISNVNTCTCGFSGCEMGRLKPVILTGELVSAVAFRLREIISNSCQQTNVASMVF